MILFHSTRDHNCSCHLYQPADLLSIVLQKACSFSIIFSLNDIIPHSTAPVIFNCPDNINQQTSDVIVTWIEPTAIDDYTPANKIQVIKTHSPGESFPLNTTPVIYAFIDGSGNSNTCSFNVTIMGE